jgi:hypothetical protein
MTIFIKHPLYVGYSYFQYGTGVLQQHLQIGMHYFKHTYFKLIEDIEPFCLLTLGRRLWTRILLISNKIDIIHFMVRI